MRSFPLSSVATMLALCVYVWTFVVVAVARAKYSIAAPAVTGHGELEKRYRVQSNTREQLILMLPARWLAASWIGDRYAAAGGVIRSLGRVLYARGCYRDPERRALGARISVLASFAMLIAVFVVAVPRAYL